MSDLDPPKPNNRRYPPPTASDRRATTSAIETMSVAEVRKCLSECRKKHQHQTADEPLYITDTLSNGLPVQEFALKFQQGHHQKRHNKSRKHPTDELENSSSEDDSDYYHAYNSSDSEDDHDDEKAPSPPAASLSHVLSAALSKKRGRPSKVRVSTPSRTEQRSRSLLDFVKPSSTTKRHKK